METKKVFIGLGKDYDFTSLAAWEASLPPEVVKTIDVQYSFENKVTTDSKFEVRCGNRSCNKKIAEIDSANLLEIQCPRCKTKTAFAVQNLGRKE